MKELTEEDQNRIKDWARDHDIGMNSYYQGFKDGARYATRFEREIFDEINKEDNKVPALELQNKWLTEQLAQLKAERVQLLVAFGVLVQLKEVGDLTAVAKKFIEDFDRIGEGLHKHGK